MTEKSDVPIVSEHIAFQSKRVGLTQLQKYDNEEINPYYHLFTSQQ